MGVPNSLLNFNFLRVTAGQVLNQTRFTLESSQSLFALAKEAGIFYLDSSLGWRATPARSPVTIFVITLYRHSFC